MDGYALCDHLGEQLFRATGGYFANLSRSVGSISEETYSQQAVYLSYTLPAAISLGGSKDSGGGLSQIRPTLNDLAVLQYTGGTTGVAKGAMLSHGNIISCIAQGRNHFAEYNRESETRLLIAPLPIYHIFGFTLYLCGNFSSGGRSMLIPNPRDLDGLLDVMRSVPFTEFAAVNTMLVGLMANGKFDAVDWSNLKWTIAGGAALVPDVAKEWERRTDSKLIEGYGLSETTANLTLNSPATRRIGSAGQAVGFQEIKLMDARPPFITCVIPVNDGPGQWVANAAIASLDRWIRTGEPAPSAPFMTLNADQSDFELDDFGNAKGGIRTPHVDAPVATLRGTGQPPADAFCGLLGTTIRFDETKLAELYPDKQAYINAIDAATDSAVEAGFLLPADGAIIKARARTSPLPAAQPD